MMAGKALCWQAYVAADGSCFSGPGNRKMNTVDMLAIFSSSFV